MRRGFKWFFILFGLMVLALAVALGVNYKMNQKVYLTTYEYQSTKLPQSFDGYRIAVISDMHNSQYADRFITLLDDASPDLLLFAGDMIQQPDTNLDQVIKVIRSQAGRVPVYVVFGNHEAANGSAVRSALTKQLQDAGARVLSNIAVGSARGEDKIRLIGLEDDDREVLEEETINTYRKVVKRVTRKDKGERFNILLYHRADVFPELSDLPVDLVLSGHLHGGIVRLPFAGGVFGRNGELFPEYTGGMYRQHKTTMIVSRGCDYNPKKTRVFNPPEIVLVTLSKP